MYEIEIGDLIKTNTNITVAQINNNIRGFYETINNEEMFMIIKSNNISGCFQFIYKNKVFIFEPQFSRTFGGFCEPFTILNKKV